MGSTRNPNNIEVIDEEIVKEDKDDKDVIKMSTKKDQVAEYDPSKKYTWDNDATFTLSGKEFGMWLNTVRSKVSSKEGLEMRMLLECNNILEEIMARGVTSGIIKEMEPPKS